MCRFWFFWVRINPVSRIFNSNPHLIRYQRDKSNPSTVWLRINLVKQPTSNVFSANKKSISNPLRLQQRKPRSWSCCRQEGPDPKNPKSSPCTPCFLPRPMNVGYNCCTVFYYHSHSSWQLFIGNWFIALLWAPGFAKVALSVLSKITNWSLYSKWVIAHNHFGKYTT